MQMFCFHRACCIYTQEVLVFYNSIPWRHMKSCSAVKDLQLDIILCIYCKRRISLMGVVCEIQKVRIIPRALLGYALINVSINKFECSIIIIRTKVEKEVLICVDQLSTKSSFKSFSFKARSLT